jgi:hypothetical protein
VRAPTPPHDGRRAAAARRCPGCGLLPDGRRGAAHLHRIVNSQEFDILWQNFAIIPTIYKTRRKTVNKFTKKSFQ